MEKDKQAAHKRKMQEKEHLKLVLEENEKNKKILAANLQKEREEDIKACEDYTRMLDKQEEDRENYFKMRAKRQNEFMSQMAENVIKVQDEYLQKELDTINKYQQAKDQKDLDEENRRKLQIKMNKKDMKAFLETQMIDKKKILEFEKTLDEKQLKIWREDLQSYLDREKDLFSKTKMMKKDYNHYLKDQMVEQNLQKKSERMNDNEYLFNKELLENFKKTTSQK